MIRVLVIAMAIVGWPPPSARAQPAGTVAYINATVWPTPSEIMPGATVVVRDGKVIAMGKSVPVPSGARVIDAQGTVITAGLIAASSVLGLVEVSGVASTNEGKFNQPADRVHAAYRVTDGYNPYSVAIPIARLGGVTAAIVAPRGDLVAGTSSMMRTHGTKAKEYIASASAAVHATLGVNALRAGYGSRGMAALRLRQLLNDSREYSRSKTRYRRNRSRLLAAEQLDLEAMIPVLKGLRPLVVRADRASDIRAALAIQKEFRLKMIIEGATEAHLVAEELKVARVPVIIDPSSNLPSTFDEVHVVDDHATRLADAGVEFALTRLRSSIWVRRLRQIAGNAIARGLSREHALAAITTTPASIFGAKDLGRILVGRPADLVVWSGDPFELSTRPLHIYVNGTEVSMESRQTKLRDRYLRR